MAAPDKKGTNNSTFRIECRRHKAKQEAARERILLGCIFALFSPHLPLVLCFVGRNEGLTLSSRLVLNSPASASQVVGIKAHAALSCKFTARVCVYVCTPKHINTIFSVSVMLLVCMVQG